MLRRVADRRDAMTCMGRHEGGEPTGLLTLSVSGRNNDYGDRQGLSTAEAIGVSGGKIGELHRLLPADATEAASAEIFGEELPGERNN